MAIAAGGDLPPPVEPDEGAGGLLRSLGAVLHELPGLVSDRVRLLSLELRRAGRALAQIVVLAVAAALLAITAWLALWVGIGALLVYAGLGWGWAVLAVIVVNVAAAWFAVQRAIALAALLGLPSTVRRLTVASDEPPPVATTAHEQQPLAS